MNNAFYETLGERWYRADDDPVALLRAEGRLKNPWISEQIRARFNGPRNILDIGCGAGFLANALARENHRVYGLDASAQSLKVARGHDCTHNVAYLQGDAYTLPFADASSDVVCALDFLEHVERPAAVISEAARVLQPQGLFFYHTFNRNPLSWLFALKGIEWFVKNTPPKMHAYHLFLKPSEVEAMCARSGLRVETVRGIRPCFSRAFWRLLSSGVVPKDFSFDFTESKLISYVGLAVRI